MKLTLSIEADAVRQAKRHARSRRTSVSELATEYFLGLRGVDDSRESGLTRKLTGVIALPAGIDERALVAEAILEKHQR
ncbi:MAG: DUF6364 family protein [Verrucomicrobiales bacterium]